MCNWSGFRGACGAVCRLITAVEDQAVLGGSSLRERSPEPHCRLLALWSNLLPWHFEGSLQSPYLAPWLLESSTQHLLLRAPTGPSVGSWLRGGMFGTRLHGGTLPSPLSVNSWLQ